MKSLKEHRYRKSLSLTLLALAVLVASFFSFGSLLRGRPQSAGVIFLTGRIDTDDSAISTKTAGRIREIKVREGDAVKAGDVIAMMDAEQVQAREEQARSTLQQSEARLQRARQQSAVLQEQLTQSQIAVKQSRQDAEGRVQQAEAQLAAAEASAAQADALYEQARYDAEKYELLAKKGVESERAVKQSRTIAEAHLAAVRAAHRQVEAARGAVEISKANFAYAAIHSSQSAAVKQQILQAESDVEALKADCEHARGLLKEARANRNDLTITAPFDGIVVTRSAETGEVVAAGTVIVTLMSPSDVYVRGFVPEGEIGRVRLGQLARVYLDSAPSQFIEASVTRIDPQTTFTPENTYFRDDRIKQVVGVKLHIKSTEGFAKPGMPAEAEILVEGDSWPESKNR